MIASPPPPPSSSFGSGGWGLAKNSQQRLFLVADGAKLVSWR
jgi:hypothetical protein